MSCGWDGVARKSPRAAGASRPASTIPTASLVLLTAALLFSACRPAEDRVARMFASSANWVDLTHSFDEHTIYWPTAEPFKLEMVSEGMTPGGYYYSAANFAAAEHGGTHIDAPVHFAKGRHTTDQIPVTQLIGAAVVVDVAAKVTSNPDYRVVAADLQEFEARHGRIADGTIVLFRTGWGSRWPERKAYLGTETTGAAAVPQLHFPGIDSTAARWLVAERKVDAIGIDTPSIDYGQSSTFDVHQILFAADIPAFENVANLDQLPETGAFVVALPMKIAGGTGGPLRIVAAIP
ncbi:MAG: cyclase family protein [Gemmatimonadetes bacterium]|nr:cyclase family protein [Gemmatimonadota bacterium]